MPGSETSSQPATPRVEAEAVDEAALQARIRPDLRGGLRWFLALDVFVRVFLWCTTLAFTASTFTALNAWPQDSLVRADWSSTWRWSWTLGRFILLFNIIYVLELVLLRLPIPTPKEGIYPTMRRTPNREVLWSCLVAVLTKARAQAPFPGIFVFHFANLPPLSWLMEPVFGPRSKSCYVADPQILDPHLVTLGRNVTVGFGSTIAGHYQDRDVVVFKRTVIEDDVVIGGHAVIPGGVHIGRSAVIGASSFVLPNSVVGPNEYWSGVPARRRRELPSAAVPESS